MDKAGPGEGEGGQAVDDAAHDRAWSPVATDLATVARLLDDVSYPVHLTAVGDDDHVMVAANRATLELLGRTWEEVCGRPLGEVITDGGALATMRRRRDQAVDTLGPVFHEFGIDLPEGSRRYEATLVPVTDGNGGCTHVFGVWRDATSERERMRDAEARSRAILDATPDVIVTVHRDGTILTIDGSIRQVLDDADGIVGQRITDLQQSDLTDRVMHLVTDALDTGDLHVDEMVVDIAGLELLLEARVVPLGPDVALGIGRDVTERKRSEDALRESEARFRFLATDAPVGIFQTDAEGKCTFANSYACELTGMDLEQSLGYGWTDSVHPDDRERVLDVWQDAAARGATFDLDYRFRTSEGRISWVTGHAVPLRDEHGTITGYLGTILDISDRQQAEQLRAAHVGAEQLVSAISRRVLTASADDIDGVIRDALRETGLFVGASAAALHRYSDDGAWVVRSHWWSARAAEPVGDDVPERFPALPEIADALGEADHLVVDVADLPDDSVYGRDQLESGGVGAIGMLPVRSGGRVNGFIAFTWLVPVDDSVRAVLPTLRVLADVLVAALERTRTERERLDADDALRRSEERFRALVQHGSDVTTVLDPEGRIIYVSPASRAVLGWSETDVLGKAVFEFVHPDDVDQALESFGNLLQDPGPKVPLRVRLRHGDGSWRIVESVANNLLDDPAVGGFVLNTRDVTERVEAEEALRRNEERFRALVQNSSDMVTVLDADGVVQYTSPASRRILGLDESDQAGELGFDRVHPDDLDAITRVFTEALEKPGPTDPVQVRLRHEDGSWRTIEAVGTNLLDDPAVQGLVVNGRDITERIRLEEHFGALVQSTSDMITVLDSEGRIVYSSPAAEVILGWAIPEWIGRSVFELVHPDDLDRVGARFVQAVAEEGVTEPVEFRMRRSDDSWVQIEGIGNSLFHDPAVGGLVVTARDVTDRKRLEAQLLQAQKMEAVGQLAGGVAHDFNNLLTAITGYTALLLDATAVGDPRREDLEEIANAGARAATLVDQLLSFSRRRTVQPTQLDLNEVVQSMRSLVDRLLPADLEVVTELGAGLDPIAADRSQVEQVLMNLVVNARDAMAEGGRLVIETTTIHLEDEAAAAPVGVVPGDYVMLAVSDDGIGMDAATRARVFEPFFTTKDVGQGTGLGLSTVYGIVTQAGGQVAVYSEPDRGTTIRVYFPTVEGGAADRPTEAPVEAQASGTETILLVEDETAVRALASQVLTRLGYSVLEAADGQDALEVAHAHQGRIDLLLTDVVLPRASGIEVAEKLTVDRPELPVLFMSGYTETAIGQAGELDGHFLAKPFQPADLTRRVRKILDGPPRP